MIDMVQIAGEWRHTAESLPGFFVPVQAKLLPNASFGENAVDARAYDPTPQVGQIPIPVP